MRICKLSIFILGNFHCTLELCNGKMIQIFMDFSISNSLPPNENGIKKRKKNQINYDPRNHRQKYEFNLPIPCHIQVFSSIPKKKKQQHYIDYDQTFLSDFMHLIIKSINMFQLINNKALHLMVFVINL